MSIVLELTPVEERRLNEAAHVRKLRPEVLAHQLVVEHLPNDKAAAKDPMIALLDQWDEEDANMSPEEIAEEQRQWEELKANLNAERARAGSRLLF